jgi:hypothetical protein
MLVEHKDHPRRFLFSCNGGICVLRSSWGQSSMTTFCVAVANRPRTSAPSQETRPETPLRDHLPRIKHICQRLKSSNAELNLEIDENSPMGGARDRVHHRKRRLLVEAELHQPCGRRTPPRPCQTPTTSSSSSSASLGSTKTRGPVVRGSR